MKTWIVDIETRKNDRDQTIGPFSTFEKAQEAIVNECGEWFQKEIVTKDMKELKRRVGEFQKVVQETYARMQQAGVAYQDIGHILGRYYDLKGNQGADQSAQQVPGPQPLQEKSQKKK